MKINCLFDKMVPIKDLKPNPRNPNTHSAEQIVRLAALLSYYGWRKPLIISNRSGFINTGHGTLLAAKHNGWTEVPVSFQDFESEEQEYGFLVADNASKDWSELDLSSINAAIPDLGPDFDLELLGIKDFVLDPADKESDGTEDEVPEPPKEAKSRRGDLWTLGTHRVLCGDSTCQADVAALMDGQRADLVFTSPPYSDLRDYGGNLDLTVETLGRIFNWPTRLFIVNLGLIIRERKIVPYWNEWLLEASKRDLPLLSWNVWDKGNASSVGHQQAMFGLSHEWIFVLGDYRELNRTKENKLGGGGSWSGVSQRQKDGSLVRKDAVQVGKFRQLDSVFQLQSLRNFSDDYTGHPAAFPSEFPLEFINAATKDGAIVGEPFCGSGSTLIACEKTNRRCFGMEIDPIYVDVILTRWAKQTGKDPVRSDGVKWSELVDTKEGPLDV